MTPTIFKQGPARNAALNVTTMLSPTMTNEFIFGPSQNNLTLDPVDPNAATFSGIGLTFAPPFAYAPGQFINLQFSGTSGISYAGINAYSQFPYKNSNTTFDFIDNVSKVWGTHTSKAGIFVQRNRKDQAAGDSMRITFGNNSSNPGNTGHPYANALLGNFDTFSEPTRGIYQGQYRYTNVEWFLQDNWKASHRLTLDYGLRFFWIQPQYDQRLQDAYFNPSLYDASKQVRLYQRGRAGADFAFDPQNPSVRLPSFLIGRIVPGSGDIFNGLGQAKNGYYRGGLKNPGIALGPAVGFAYDVFGSGKTVIRGGYRIGFDRVPGNTLIFPATGSPPSNVVPVFNFGNLDTVGASTGQIALAPFNVEGADPNGKPPYIQSFSLQVQQEVGFDTVVSVAYVGTLSHRLPQARNLNYIPYGATFLKQNQDPASFGGTVPDQEANLAQVYKDAGLNFSGSNALRQEFLRRYPGFGQIRYWEFVGSSNYHSLQATVQRRYKQGLTYGLSYTFSKAMGTASGDGDFNNPVCTRCYDYRLLSFDRKHILAINYIWNLPTFSRWMGNHWAAKRVLDGWELSGITQMMSGTPTELGFSIPNVSLNQRLTGSYTEGPRLVLTKDPQKGFDKSAEHWFDFTAFRLPNVGDIGPWPRTYMRNPGVNVTDLSLFKNFALGKEGARRLQLRLEMFNVFNHPQFTGFNGGLTWNVASNFSDYAQKQQGSASVLSNVRGGTFPPSAATDRLGRAVGEFNGQPDYVSKARVIQLAAKIYF